MRTPRRRPSTYTLNEPFGHGTCPVCRKYWLTDPRGECDCTRSQPDDDKQMQAAYLQSALCRTAKLNPGWPTARRRRQTDSQSWIDWDRGNQPGNVVVPLTRPRLRAAGHIRRPARRLPHRRAR